MTNKAHWEAVYRSKPPHAVSWYRAHLERSLQLVERSCPRKSESIIDVGGGESTLVDDLLAREYRNVTVLDLSETALEVARQRLGADSRAVTWIAGDVLGADLPRAGYDLWHDRAVFHFLTAPADRAAYVRQVTSSVKAGGHVIVATFGPQGPARCSGLDVARYDPASLQAELGACFRLLSSSLETHQTPSGGVQQYLYCLYRIERH